MTDSNADVAVIGLGAMGAMSAWRLAARGVKVIGFERFRPGHDRGSSHGDTRIFRTAYFESPEYVPLLQRAYGLWRQLETESGAELLTITGGLAIGPPHGELVAGVVASARVNGLAYRLLDVDEMKSLYPQHRLERGEVGVREEDAGYLRPERSVAAAAARAEALGARLVVETQVESVRVSGAGVVIETSRGRFAAQCALVAAGAWTPTVMAELGMLLKVERQVMAWLAVDDPASFAPERFPVFIRETADGRFRYGFPTTDGRSIKLGRHHEGVDVDPDSIDREVGEPDLQPIRDFARATLRSVTDNVVEACVCMYTNTPDERFLVTSPRELPGVTVISACSGHGFKFAPALGELMAGSILEGGTLPDIIRTA